MNSVHGQYYEGYIFFEDVSGAYNNGIMVTAYSLLPFTVTAYSIMPPTSSYINLPLELSIILCPKK